jgi:hypothetical protein
LKTNKTLTKDKRKKIKTKNTESETPITIRTIIDLLGLGERNKRGE